MNNKKIRSVINIVLFFILLTSNLDASVLNSENNLFPIPMTFRAFDNISPGTDAFEDQLSNHAMYPIIHAPGFGTGQKSKLVKAYWPNKTITIQDAYGGVTTKVISRVWPGHLLYKAGTLITQNITQEEFIFPVQNRLSIAKDRKLIKKVNKVFPFSLVIYALNDQGKPDWDHAEYVTLEDIVNGKLKVQRGQWGSKPLSFQAGKAVVAAPMMFWTRQWQLNLSLDSPRGGPGNLTAAEWFARELANKVRESNADGIELDVGRWTWGFPAAHPMDSNNDLMPDYGYHNGINSFGLGGRVLFRELRKQLGPDKIIQVDSNDAAYGVRGWRDLNGVQLESFPGVNDFKRFSEAFLHLRLWVENAEIKPRFSYAFTKTPTTVFENAYLPNNESTDFRFRVGFAVACLVGMPHAFASLSHDEFDPANPTVKNRKAEQRFGIFAWDEYHAGDLNNWQWLGRPLGAAQQHFNDLKPINLLANVKWQWKRDQGFIANSQSSNGVFATNIQYIPEGVLPHNLWFGVRLEPQVTGLMNLVANTEYTLEFEARGNDGWNYAGQVFDRVPRMIAIGGAIATRNKKPLSLLVDSQWRTYRISFIANDSGMNTPIFGMSEQIGAAEIRNIKLYQGSAERWSREFENGLVLLNMSQHPWQFPIEKGVYKRLKGKQVPTINNGSLVEDEVTVPVHDAVFLIKR